MDSVYYRGIYKKKWIIININLLIGKLKLVSVDWI